MVCSNESRGSKLMIVVIHVLMNEVTQQALWSKFTRVTLYRSPIILKFKLFYKLRHGIPMYDPKSIF